jgi:hypothetical protein
MASGAPETSISTAPQKQPPVNFILSLPILVSFLRNAASKTTRRGRRSWTAATIAKVCATRRDPYHTWSSLTIFVL